MAKQINTDYADIYIQIRAGNNGQKLVMIKIDNNPWQEITLPTSIVKEKIIDAKFWKFLINYLIKE